MKVIEIIQRIQSLYSKGAQSDDSRLSDRHIYNKLLTLRSKYISQQAKKKQKVNQWNFQTLYCVELEKTNMHNCPCIAPIGCEILKTKYELPRPLSDLNTHLIQSVSSIEGSILFSEISWEDVKYKASSKYTSNKPDYFIRDGYLYIVGLTQRMKHLKLITITGLFEDPVKAQSFPSKCNEGIEETNCISPLEMEFAVDGEFIDWIISEAAQELVTLFGAQKEDATNNSRDNIIEESK